MQIPKGYYIYICDGAPGIIPTPTRWQRTMSSSRHASMCDMLMMLKPTSRTFALDWSQTHPYPSLPPIYSSSHGNSRLMPYSASSYIDSLSFGRILLFPHFVALRRLRLSTSRRAHFSQIDLYVYTISRRRHSTRRAFSFCIAQNKQSSSISQPPPPP